MDVALTQGVAPFLERLEALTRSHAPRPAHDGSGAPDDVRDVVPPARDHDGGGLVAEFTSYEHRRDAGLVASQQRTAGVVAERLSFTSARLEIGEDGFSAEFVSFEYTRVSAFVDAALDGERSPSALGDVFARFAELLDRLGELLSSFQEALAPFLEAPQDTAVLAA